MDIVEWRAYDNANWPSNTIYSHRWGAILKFGLDWCAQVPLKLKILARNKSKWTIVEEIIKSLGKNELIDIINGRRCHRFNLHRRKNKYITMNVICWKSNGTESSSFQTNFQTILLYYPILSLILSLVELYTIRNAYPNWARIIILASHAQPTNNEQISAEWKYYRIIDS